ncbi:MAG: hypothetical protein R8K53_06960 [Mariprofundaceae bacterium]
MILRMGILFRRRAVVEEVAEELIHPLMYGGSIFGGGLDFT